MIEIVVKLANAEDEQSVHEYYQDLIVHLQAEGTSMQDPVWASIAQLYLRKLKEIKNG